jgi:hypothetical protein
MADGELTVKLDLNERSRLKAAADAAGLPVEAYAAALIRQGLPPREDDWAVDRAIADEADRTGSWLTVEEAMVEFDKAMAAHLSGKLELHGSRVPCRGPAVP